MLLTGSLKDKPCIVTVTGSVSGFLRNCMRNRLEHFIHQNRISVCGDLQANRVTCLIKNELHYLI